MRTPVRMSLAYPSSYEFPTTKSFRAKESSSQTEALLKRASILRMITTRMAARKRSRTVRTSPSTQ